MNWGYIAGMIDGEGSIMIKKRGGGFLQPEVVITNTDYNALQKIKDFTGGGFIVNISKNYVDHSHIKRKKILWRLHYSSIPMVHYVLKNTISDIIIKKDKAISTFNYCEQKIINKSFLKNRLDKIQKEK